MVERAMAEAVADTTPRCLELVRRELELGHPLSERDADGCGPLREQVGQRLARQRPRTSFGVVDHRHVDLVRIRLRLSTARACDRWPLRVPESTSLRAAEATRSRCRLRPYRGPLTLTLESETGSVTLDHLDVRSDRDGYVELAFADIDATLRVIGAGTLDGYSRLELGEGAWAGAIDLGRWRAVMAEYHYRWVERGRGSPALFHHRHGGRSRGEQAFALALEARLARQERDLALVEEGRLTPQAFIERHVWSPFRRAVERMLADMVETAPR